MKKNIIIISALISSTFAFSQVGINTETPQTTLDVVGKPAEPTAMDGIIAPRITGDQLRAKTYTTDQTGALVYVTAADTAPAGQTVDVTAPGYYYFDGTKWVITSSGGSDTNTNIYTVDGSITGTQPDPDNVRTLTLNNNKLDFVGTNKKTRWQSDGTLYQMGLGTGTGAIGITSGEGDDFGSLWLQQFHNGFSGITSAGAATHMVIGPSYTNGPAYIRFNTTSEPDQGGQARMYITPNGNVGIGSGGLTASEKLDVIGVARVRQLPINGAANSISTLPNGTASTSQNQTFNASRTVVADANGVLGYVEGLPAGTTVTAFDTSVGGSGAVSSSFNVNGAGWTLVPGASQTVTVPAGGKAIFLNFMLGIDYGPSFPANSGASYYTARVFIDGVESNIFLTTQESGPNGTQTQYTLNGIKFLTEGTHTVDVRMRRTFNNGVSNTANMQCGVMSMNFSAAFIN